MCLYDCAELPERVLLYIKIREKLDSGRNVGTFVMTRWGCVLCCKLKGKRMD